MSPETASTALAGFLVETTVKGSLLLVVVGLVALTLRRRSAADRHFVWMIGVVGLLLLPVLSRLGPEWPVGLPGEAGRLLPRLGWRSEAVRTGSRQGEIGGAAAGAGSVAARGDPIEQTSASIAVDGRSAARSLVYRVGVGITMAWLFGALAILASFALAWWGLSGVARRATPLDARRWRERVERAARDLEVDARHVRVRRATEPVTPLTWGVVRPVVILPPSCEGWSDEQARAVLVHEISHICRRDCLTQNLSSLACVLHWFNPLAWLAARRMLTERERACDDQVLLSGARASDYANDLLEIARSLGAPWAASQISTAMARRSQIAGRLLAVLDPHLARGGAGRGGVVLASLLGLAVVLPLAAVGAAPPTGIAATSASAAIPAGPTPRVSADLASVRQELRAWKDGLEAALNRGDTEEISRFYTADTELVVPLLPVVRGRKGVRDLFEHLISGGVTILEHETHELYPVGGMVLEIGTTCFRHRAGAVVQVSHEMTLWRREDGAWHIHREVSLPLNVEDKR